MSESFSGQPLICNPSTELCSVCAWCWEDHDQPLKCRLYPEKKIHIPFWQIWENKAKEEARS